MSFVFLALSAAPLWAHSSSCTDFMANLGQDSLPFFNLDKKATAAELVKRKLPPMGWFNSVNSKQVTENREAIVRMRNNLEARLIKLLANKNSANGTLPNSILYKDEIKIALALANNLLRSQPTNIKVNKLVAHYVAIVAVEAHIHQWVDFKRNFDDQINATETMLAGWKGEMSLEENYSIYPKMIFTFRKIDEIDLVLATSRGVFYVGLSDHNNINFDNRKNATSIQFTGHDVEAHAKSQLNSLHSYFKSNIFTEIIENRFSENPHERLHFLKEARYRIALFLVTQAHDTEALMTDILTISNRQLREVLILTVFQTSHEYTEVIKKETLINETIKERMWNKYNAGEFEQGKFLGLSKEDFDNAQAWLSNWFKNNKGRFT